jgi:LPXTG-motif cell wall-anchored protein
MLPIGHQLSVPAAPSPGGSTVLRRTLFTAAAAAALVLVPTAAATAYQAPGFAIATDDPTPAVGEAFTVTVDGTTPGESYTLAVTTSSSVVTDAVVGDATKVATGTSLSWTVRLSDAGSYRLAVTDSSGALVSDLTVTVAAATASRGGGRTAADDDGEMLSDTGFDGMNLAIAAGGLMVIGAGAVVVARRRQETGA